MSEDVESLNSDDDLSLSILTQKDQQQSYYEFLDSGDEDENAFPFSPIFGKTKTQYLSEKEGARAELL